MASTLHVVGVGTATVTPEIAELSIGLQSMGGAPGSALAEVTAAAQAVLAAARDNGVSDAGLRTQEVAVHARVDPHSGVINGYQAAYLLRLRVTQVSTASLVIDAITQAAGDALRLGGLDLAPADIAAARATAAANAVTDARSRAERVAEAAGLRLGPVISIVEGSPTPYGQPIRMMAKSARDLGSGPPIQVGSNEITAQVGVTFHTNNLPG